MKAVGADFGATTLQLIRYCAYIPGGGWQNLTTFGQLRDNSNDNDCDILQLPCHFGSPDAGLYPDYLPTSLHLRQSCAKTTSVHYHYLTSTTQLQDNYNEREWNLSRLMIEAYLNF
jgi:hypothetical protein